MPIKLMPSQELALNKIIDLEQKSFRRNNSILFGKIQTGKSELVSYISDNYEKYIYKNFTEEYLEKFLAGKRVGNIMMADLQVFLRETFFKLQKQNEIVILDEIDSLIPIITNNVQHANLVLYKQLLTMDQPLRYIFVTSCFDEEIVEKLADEFGNRVVVLDFLKKDKQYIVEHYFSNIKLFDFEEITNLRQMFNKKHKGGQGYYEYK